MHIGTSGIRPVSVYGLPVTVGTGVKWPRRGREGPGSERNRPTASARHLPGRAPRRPRSVRLAHAVRRTPRRRSSSSARVAVPIPRTLADGWFYLWAKSLCDLSRRTLSSR
jgi:hypothetical protein